MYITRTKKVPVRLCVYIHPSRHAQKRRLLWVDEGILKGGVLCVPLVVPLLDPIVLVLVVVVVVIAVGGQRLALTQIPIGRCQIAHLHKPLGKQDSLWSPVCGWVELSELNQNTYVNEAKL